MELSVLSHDLHALPLGTQLAGAALVLFLSMLALRLFSNACPGKAPPVEEGIPFVGGLIKFSKGPLPLMTELYAKHGEAFTVPLLHKKMTFLIGPHVAPHFYNATDDKMSQSEVYDFNVPTFGRGVVYDVDQRVRSEQFRWVANALQTTKLRSYVPAFKLEAEEYFSKWEDEGVVDFMAVFSELIILTASRTLLGREIRESMFREVADLYHDLDDGMRPISVIFPYLPTAFHRKRDAACAALHAIFKKVITSRRASAAKEDDILQVLIDSRYRNVYGGRATTDNEIAGLLIALLFAGQHTSSVTSSWTGYRMLANPQWWKASRPTPALDSCLHTCLYICPGSPAPQPSQQPLHLPTYRLLPTSTHHPFLSPHIPIHIHIHTLAGTPPSLPPLPAPLQAAQEEQRHVMAAHGDALDMDVLNGMNTLHLNIQEALRMNPPLIMVMRLAKEAFPVTTSTGKTFVVPKGHIVAASPTFAHRLPHIFKEPDEYQPDRYLPPREEDKPVKLSYVGFGGGRHACMGQNFAYLQIKTLWSVMLRNFEFELLDPVPEPDYTSMVIGPKACRVRYRRKKLVA
ncbi:Obtusifoliol 14-alpha demethylase [Chlorella vulgaris]